MEKSVRYFGVSNLAAPNGKIGWMTGRRSEGVPRAVETEVAAQKGKDDVRFCPRPLSNLERN